MLAPPLLVPPKVHLVAPRDLPGDPHACVLPRAIIQGLMAIVRVIRPLGYVARIFVAPQRYILAVALVPRGPIKPEPVLHDGTSKRAIEVPEFLQLVGGAQTGITQRLSIIAPLQTSRSAIEEESAMKFIAAHLWQDIHDRSARRRLAHAAGDGEVNFLRVPNIRHIKRDA